MKPRLLFVLILFGSSMSISFGQRFKIQDVTLQELQNNNYERDSSAGAVVLFDIGKLSSAKMEFTRRMRVKVLKKSGLEWGNWVFNIPSKADVRISVHNLENGEIIREKATAKNIFEEEVIEGLFTVKVFAPNVKVGSIIDIYYSHLGPPSEWWFQRQIPVVYSELTLESSGISLNTTHFGFEPIEALSNYEWRAQNMPAFKAEPFLSDYSNYITKFSIIVRSFPAGWGRPLSTTWKAVNYRLLEFLKSTLNGGPHLNDFVNETKAKNLGTQQKIQAAYDYVQANLRWDGRKTILPSVVLKKNFTETHNGNSADINVTLVALLNELDVKSYPLLLSTRDNGMLLEHSPNLFKLNYVVAYVKTGDVEMLIDATSPGVMPGILPDYCINGSGLICQPDIEQWVDLTPKQGSVKRQFINIVLDKAGTATASLSNAYSGYGYTSWANELKEYNRDLDRMKNKIQKDNPDVKLIKYEVARDEPAKCNSREVIELDASSLLIDAGEEALFNPFLLSELDVNPFMSETRKYPIDINYPRELSTTVTVALNGFSLKQMPESVKFSLPDKSATFLYSAGSDGKNLQLRMVLKVDRQVYTETEYQDLRRFYSEVVKKVSSLIELKRI